MGDQAELVFYHAPNTRSTGVRVLLEALGAPFEMRVLNAKKGEQRQPAYLAVNPMGKVPAIVHRGALITEQPAIFIYLADLFPASGLAPALGDALRGPYLRWLAFYGGSFEPALIDRALQRAPGSLAMSPYGDFETMFETLVAQLARGPWILGDRFSAADLLWGTALGWVTAFKLVPERAEVLAYAERVNARPAAVAVRAREAELAAAQATENTG
jgi:glutathione S-transferase